MRLSRIVAGLLGGVVVAAGLVALTRDQSAGTFGSAPRRGLDLPGECGGTFLSLQEAAGLVDFQVLVPSHQLANDATLGSVEWCRASDLLVLSYKTGVRVELSPSQLSNPEQEFEQQAESYEGTTAGEIRGKPAVFIEPGSVDTSSVEPAPGGVEFVEGKVLVDVVGDGSIPLDDLKDITDSLRTYTPSSTR